MTADPALVAELAEVLLLAGPDLEDAEPSGEWPVTVARGTAKRALDWLLAAGWRPPIDVPPAAERATPPACETATPAPPAGGTTPAAAERERIANMADRLAATVPVREGSMPFGEVIRKASHD